MSVCLNLSIIMVVYFSRYFYRLLTSCSRMYFFFQIDLDLEEDNLSLSESRLSDTEVDLLEQKVLELNQRLNIKTTECENAKKELEISQVSAVKSQERAEELNVAVSSCSHGV